MSDSNPNLPLNSRILGCDDSDMAVFGDAHCLVHADVIEPLQYLADAAQSAGFTLRVASAFRSFERQLSIWNAKAAQLRPVLDEAGAPIDMSLLSDDEKMFAILRWSALPGASRHHWGTDMDIYDQSRMPLGYQVQLTVAETEGDGVFAEFHQWLSQQLSHHSFGFFRPYVAGIGGIAPEPWHLSYAPLANQFATQLTEDMLRRKIHASDILLKDSILGHLDHIFAVYVTPYRG